MDVATKRVLALTLILLFIAILLIALIDNLKEQKQEEKRSQTTYVILDSSQTYSDYRHYSDYNPYSEKHYPSTYRDIQKLESLDCLQEAPKITSAYSFYAKKEQEKDFLGSYVTRYIVSVLNKGNTGNYFTVTFNFNTQTGFEYSETITQYLRAGERKEFLYKDVQFEKTEILRWGYEVNRN